jgi:hypothetical protein
MQLFTYFLAERYTTMAGLSFTSVRQVQHRKVFSALHCDQEAYHTHQKKTRFTEIPKFARITTLD